MGDLLQCPRQTNWQQQALLAMIQPSLLLGFCASSASAWTA